MTTKTTADAISVCNLTTRNPRPIRNWHEWLEQWNKAEVYEVMLGLLHTGFDVSMEQSSYEERKYAWSDRVIFYFSIADGWNDSALLMSSVDGKNKYYFGYDRDGRIEKKPCQMRQLIAKKALEVLCLHFFKNFPDRGNERYFNAWEGVLFNDKLLPVIMNFFRYEKTGWKEQMICRNLPKPHRDRNHFEKQVIEFLMEMANYLWRWKEQTSYVASSERGKEERELNKNRRKEITKAQLWMLEVLDQLQVLELVELESLNDACIKKLTEIALRKRLLSALYGIAKDRPVKNVEEAAFVGSTAARLVLEASLIKKVNEEFAQERQNTQRRIELQRELEELEGGNKSQALV